MSNGVFGSGSSSSSSSRVSIPSNVKKTIHDIREITGKQHSDDEIYAVLRECSMDPNETINKLMYLDTFHEVKRRRERRKENINGKASEERPAVGFMRKGSRAGHGNYSSNFSSDAGGGRNGGRRENGAMSFSHRARNNAQSRAARVSSTALPNGTASLANGHGQKSLADSEAQSLNNVGKMGSADSELAVGTTSSPILGSPGTEQAKSDEIPPPVVLPASDANSLPDSLSAPSILGQYSGGASTMENKVGTQQWVVETSFADESEVVADDNVSLDRPERDEDVDTDISGEKENGGCAPREVVQPEVAAITEEISSLSTSEPNVSNGQHVTFPSHFQVPEALKNGLTFGSFDVTFGPSAESVNVIAENGNVDKTSQDSVEAAKETTPRDRDLNSLAEGGNLSKLQPVTQSVVKLQLSKGELPKPETQFLPDSHQSHIISLPSYLGLMPPMVGSQLVSYEGHETQAHESHIPIYSNGNTLVPPSTNPSPPLPSSITMSPQSLPVFRQTYPPSFYPYGQYISPYYIPPMHQYLGHNGFAPQPATGNVYLPQAAPAAGVKFSMPQFKPGNTAANPTHIGMQPAGSYITTPIGYAQPVTSGSSMGNDELMATHMKESQMYTTGQLQSEGTGVWVHAAGGQEMPTMQMNSLYNLPPQPHITFTPQQPSHAGAYATMFPAGHHAMTATPTLLQQSQAAPGGGPPIETIGQQPAGPAYQQPSHPPQISWNTAAF